MKKMKIKIAMGLSLIVLAGCVGSPAAPIQASEKAVASDISGHWAETYIQAAAEAGYVDGYPDGTFRPDASISRAEFIKMAAAALKLQLPGRKTGEDWFGPYVSAAQSEGITLADEFATAEWPEAITRQELATLSVRAGLTDARNASRPAAQFFYEATKAGLIQGLSGGELGKDQLTTRAQAVTLVERIKIVLSGGTLEVDKDAASYAEVEYRGSNTETMLGVLPKPLPLDPELGGPLTYSLDRMLVVDLTREDSAFRSLFPAGAVKKKNTDEPIGNDYLVALHFNVANETAGEGYFKVATFGASPPLTEAIITTEGKSLTTVRLLPAIDLKKVYSFDGWYLFTISKEYANSQLEQNRLQLYLDKISSKPGSKHQLYLTEWKKEN